MVREDSHLHNLSREVTSKIKDSKTLYFKSPHGVYSKGNYSNNSMYSVRLDISVTTPLEWCLALCIVEEIMRRYVRVSFGTCIVGLFFH